MRPKASMPYHTAAVIAGALELTTGYHRIYDTRMSNTSLTKGFSDWAQSVTCNGRFKFCNVEMKMPFPFDLANSMTGDTSLSKPLLPLWATYDATLRMPTAYSMNPFMKSLSASVYGQWSADPKFLKKEREAKPYSNVLTIRGSRSGGKRFYVFINIASQLVFDTLILIYQICLKTFFDTAWAPRIWFHMFISAASVCLFPTGTIL